MTITERMDAALELLQERWPRRAAKAFYLGPADWDEFMATRPRTATFLWGNNPVKERVDPEHKGLPVRFSKNVAPKWSKLYDHSGSGHVLPLSFKPKTETCSTDYAAVEAKLHALSLTRALTDEESYLLERAIKRQAISVRECVRLGVKRRMDVYNRPLSATQSELSQTSK